MGSLLRFLSPFTLATLLLGTTAFAGGTARPPVVTGPQPVLAQDIFDRVINELSRNYAGPSPISIGDLRLKFLPELQKVCSGQTVCVSEKAYPVIKSLLAELKDKHTNFLTPAQLIEAKKSLVGQTGSHKTFGLLTEPLGSGGQVVLEVLPGSPAQKAGIQVADILQKVNNIALNGEAGGKAYQRASQGRKAAFTLNRQGKMINVTLTAASMLIPPVTLRKVEGVNVLRLRHFHTVGVADQVHRAIREVGGQVDKGLVLDLRYNGGGRAEEERLSAGAFMQPRPIIWQELFNSRKKISYDHGQYVVNGVVQGKLKNPTRYTGLLVVLVNRFTASAAESLTLALLERPCTLVMGEPTAGMADTASYFAILPDGAGLQVTFAQTLDEHEKRVSERIVPAIAADLRASQVAATGRDVALEQAMTALESLEGCQR